MFSFVIKRFRKEKILMKIYLAAVSSENQAAAGS